MHPTVTAIILICITLGAMCIGHQFPEWLKILGNSDVKIPVEMNRVSAAGFACLAFGLTALSIVH